MADAKSWTRNPTSSDSGFMHDESMDHMIPDIYNRVRETNVLEDQTKYMFSIFNNISYAESLNRDFFRPIVRSEVSLGTTNFMTQSESLNRRITGKSWSIMSDFLIRIIAHDNCSDTVIACLAWHLVSSGVSPTLPESLSVDVDQDLAEYISYFENVSKGSENSDKWTTNSYKLIEKWHIADMLGCSNSKVQNAEWYLRQICSSLFSDMLDADTDISQYAGY